MLLMGVILSHHSAFGQSRISGRVIDEESGEPLLGVNITLKDKLIGTITGQDGLYVLSTQTSPPFTLIFSCVGYTPVEKAIQSDNLTLNVHLEPETIFGQEIVISASRVEEDILTSPVSIEKMGILDIQKNSSANFYDGLYKLKGVDMNINSLTFRTVNTRGFTGESNYRLNQLVDGIDNISPGLSFAAGNIFGMTELDVESVELLVGASSALYGPGGMNGTLLMKSKNPFDYQGLSFNAQAGIMHFGADYRDNPAPMGDISLRYAKAYKDKWAFKITANYLRALDWHAADFRDRNDQDNANSTRDNNPGYDGVNVYGDDIIVPVNLQDVAPEVAAGIAAEQGLDPADPGYNDFINNIISRFPDQVISRTGWKEQDLVDNMTDNLRLSGALHYRINDDVEAILQGNYSRGNSIYTAQNRFNIVDFDILLGKMEIRSSDYYIRAYAITENSGRSYDIGAAALRVQEAWKSSEEWYADYIETFTSQHIFFNRPQSEAHRTARAVADNRDRNGNMLNVNQPALPIPGTAEFASYWNPVIDKTVPEGGAKVIDKSALYHIEGMYNFSRLIPVVDLLVGASHRIFSINSEGSIFFDEPGSPLYVHQFGAFAQLSRAFWNERFTATASARYDKNEYFDGEITPRFSIVWAMDPDKLHNIRASYQTAFRFASVSDQWVDFDLGFFRAVGGQRVVQEKYNFFTNPVYPLSGSNPITGEPDTDHGPFDIPVFIPEKVTAMELGYKGLTFNKMLFIDTYIYKNTYNAFMAGQFLVQNPNTPDEQRYQTYISVDEPVSSWGWAMGADFRLMKGFYTGGNIAYNVLQETAEETGRETRFNTPDYRFNIHLGNREIIKNIGFNVNYRWQNDFLWQSNFGTSTIPAFGTLDGHIAFKMPKMKSVFKVGGSNLLNHYYTTSFGSAAVGGLYYISWHFDEFMN
jgi:hypothetical protein